MRYVNLLRLDAVKTDYNENDLWTPRTYELSVSVRRVHDVVDDVVWRRGA